MITGNNENYGRDDRNFYHPEDDIRLGSEKKENDLYAVSRNNPMRRDSGRLAQSAAIPAISVTSARPAIPGWSTRK